MRTLLRYPAATFAVMILLLVSGCSTSSNTPPSVSAKTVTAAQPPAAPEIVAARTAFWPMYTAAHQWSPDAMLLRVTQKQLPGYKSEGGKAGQWEAVFASSSRGQYRIFTYSVASVPPTTFKGVVGSLEMPWGGVTRMAMPVDLTMFSVDSDAAYQAAAADAAVWLKKNPGKELTALEIGDTWKQQVPVWYVTWGNKTSGYAALVDASSGKVLQHK